MKKFLGILLLIYTVNLYGQIEPNIDYKARAERNIKKLAKDSILLNQVSIKSDGIYMYDRSSTTPEFVLRWKEVGHFLRLCYNQDYYQMLAVYKAKKSQNFSLKDFIDFREYSLTAPNLMSGLRVALDPGHFGGTWEEAMQERRYLKVKPEELGLPASAGDQKVFEAELTEFTTRILADTLRKLGAIVFETREPGKSAVGKSFELWFKEDFEKDLEKYVESGDISPAQARLLQTESKSYVFDNLYKYIDFVQRSRKINAFQPDLTIVLHYNADEDNERYENRYSRLTDDNYSMVFVPGAFVWGELYKPAARLEFLRLLVSPDLEESERLSGFMIDGFKEMGIPAVPKENDLLHPKKYCIESKHEGVYHRNIYLTRAIEGPVSYVECLYQDNRKMFPLLLKRDFKLNGVKMPRICADVAYKLLGSIQKWVKENETIDLVR
jgi:N-acetylmuramoyl-L-alanine amidase